MSEPAQNFENHAKIVKVFLWANVLLVFPTLYFAFLAVTDFSLERVALFLFCVGAMIIAFYARVFPLGVQDRVIRLEERLRMERLLPHELRDRIPDFTTEQLVGLRFTSDEELTDLARRVLYEDISDRKEIKGAVRNWRADHQRI